MKRYPIDCLRFEQLADDPRLTVEGLDFCLAHMHSCPTGIHSPEQVAERSLKLLRMVNDDDQSLHDVQPELVTSPVFDDDRLADGVFVWMGSLGELTSIGLPDSPVLSTEGAPAPEMVDVDMREGPAAPRQTELNGARVRILRTFNQLRAQFVYSAEVDVPGRTVMPNVSLVLLDGAGRRSIASLGGFTRAAVFVGDADSASWGNLSLLIHAATE